MKVKIAIKVEKIVHYFGENPVLKGINFSLKEGDVLSIIGPNGSGKSTLIRIIAGIIKPFSGKVIFPSLKKRKTNIGKIVSYVPQNPKFFSNFSVEYFLLLSRYPHRKGFSFSEKDYRVIEEVSNSYGLNKLLKRGINNLSGGELRKVLLSGAEIQESDIILLDEPDSFLDPSSKKIVSAFIKKLKRNKKTVIFSTHDLSLVYELSDYFLGLDSGKQLVFEKTKKEKLKAYAEKIFRVSFNVFEKNKKLFFYPDI